ncbi:MAG: hydrolase [Elusimicrobia bacterium CG08_land_8_20_14_0_20_51_18]|nr:MAG: hydrolase [Elusimicrobia bacterium CG08_land_8_20_14_0_20_51_18]
MDREKTLELLKKHLKNENLIKHCLASEAVLRALALRLNENPDKWGLAGLIHDVDAELTVADPKTHTLEAEKILRESGFDEELIESVKMHNEAAHNLKREKPFHIALAAGETITGLIIATALVYPDKKLASVKPSSVLKRMKDKRFAAGASREVIMECEKLGIGIEEFAGLALKAMQDVAGELGL